MSSGGIVTLSSFNLLFFTQVLTVLTSTIKYNDYITDKGKNISIPCEADGSIMWIKDNGTNRAVIQTGTILVLTNVSEKDKGIYVCLSTPVVVIEQSSNSTPTDATTNESESESEPPASSSSNTYEIFINTNSTSAKLEDELDEYLKANLSVRTPPGPVTQLYFKPSTILGFLIWRFNRSHSGGYPVRSFTAEFRNISYNETTEERTYEHDWVRMDPINIAPNVRQMEVYKLAPNTTYEFRIWANNHLGPGEVVVTNVTTLPDTSEEDLIRLIQADIDNFDPRTWIVAVSIVLGTFVILAFGLCVVYCKEQRNSSSLVDDDDDGCDSIELIPNIILNPGFSESDEAEEPYTRTIIFGEDDESEGYDDDDDDDFDDPHEPLERLKRRVSLFFTGPTIKRI